MQKYVMLGVVVAVLVWPSPATTLQQLTLADLATKSTFIVRGTLQPSYTARRGSVIYTHYTAQVNEVWKGTASTPIDVAVPGGALNGISQVYSGAPTFTSGQDYVVFLWTSPGGLTQVMGLSQGLFSVSLISGVPTVTRAASSQNVLSASGQAINDTFFSMKLTDFHASVNQALGVPGVTN
jgi:hypothetical protein